MNYRHLHPARRAAKVAFEKARNECLTAGLDPEPFTDQLAELVIAEVNNALAEMAHHQTHGGPTAIVMLKQPLYQEIYFCDAGRQAGKALLKELNIQDGVQIH